MECRCDPGNTPAAAGVPRATRGDLAAGIDGVFTVAASCDRLLLHALGNVAWDLRFGIGFGLRLSVEGKSSCLSIHLPQCPTLLPRLAHGAARP